MLVLLRGLRRHHYRVARVGLLLRIPELGRLMRQRCRRLIAVELLHVCFGLVGMGRRRIGSIRHRLVVLRVAWRRPSRGVLMPLDVVRYRTQDDRWGVGSDS